MFITEGYSGEEDGKANLLFHAEPKKLKVEK
jgi:hypothetical protein